MARAVIIAIIGLAGGIYLLVVGWGEVGQGALARQTPTGLTYQAFVASPPEPGTVVEIEGGILLANCVTETNGLQTGAYSGIAPEFAGEVRGTNASRRFATAAPEILAIAAPIEGSQEFDALARSRTQRGVVLRVDHHIAPDLERLIKDSFPNLDLDTCPKLRIALRDTTGVGWAKVGGGLLLILLPLANVAVTAKKK